jgi:hypothetical protein
MSSGVHGQIQTPPVKNTGETPAIDREVCERCGRVDSLVGCGGRTLCEDCYYLYGSCCGEIDSLLDS